ncbi:MAG: BirA family transcriptional regulator [Chloroflexota bacterium]|nr:BirA family transcriptional regulator [Chloroflexota bacterium]
MAIAPGLDLAAAPEGARWLSRLERFDVVGSTNDVVMGWLRDGTPEVCVAVAGEQTAGRGRSGRTWVAPKDAALLLSVGFTPFWLDPLVVWRLAAIVSLAMAEAGESVAGVPKGTIRLKWPNDLVVLDRPSGAVRKVAGVLGETEGLGAAGSRAVIGIGMNAGWPRSEFPPELANGMTSLGELSRERTIEREELFDAFLARLDGPVRDLRRGVFAAEAWRARQVTSGNLIQLEWPDGSAETVSAVDVDPGSGALVVARPDGTGPNRRVLVGEIRHLRVGATV